MGRATSGVTGMRFRSGDELLAMEVVRSEGYLFTATDGGFAKRTPVLEWAARGRGTLGVKAMKFDESRGSLVGALIVGEGDEVLAITAGGGVIRTPITSAALRPLSRDTMGVRLIQLGAGDRVVAIARNPERTVVIDGEAAESALPEPSAGDTVPQDPLPAAPDPGTARLGDDDDDPVQPDRGQADEEEGDA